MKYGYICKALSFQQKTIGLYTYSGDYAGNFSISRMDGEGGERELEK